MLINAANVIRLLRDKFVDVNETDVNPDERLLCDKLEELIVAAQEAPSFRDLFTEELVYLPSQEYDSSSDDELESEDDYIPDEKKSRRSIPQSEVKKALKYYRDGTNGTRSLSVMTKNYRWIKSRADIDNILLRYEKRKNDPSRLEKLTDIDRVLFAKFMEKTNAGFTVHDIDLRRWAIEINRTFENPLKNFKASQSYAVRFKRRHSIVSRKITKFVGKTEHRRKEAIVESAKKFVDEIKPLLPYYSSSQVINCDQSSFQREMHTGRTLAIRGAKKIEAIVQNVSNLTHSYTIMPAITLEGTLLSPLYLCLQEPDGQFPKTKAVFQPINIFAEAHTSAIMTKKHWLSYLEHILLPNMEDRTLLLVDPWKTYNDREAINRIVPPEIELEIKQMPPKTTCYIQALDVYFFFFWKAMAKKIEDYVLLDDLPIKLHIRDNIIKMQSLIHFQFSAERFRPFILYAWYKAGYLTQRPERFQNPIEFCFHELAETCQCEDCDKISFIRCANCQNSLCFGHFFVEYHNY